MSHDYVALYISYLEMKSRVFKASHATTLLRFSQLSPHFRELLNAAGPVEESDLTAEASRSEIEPADLLQLVERIQRWKLGIALLSDPSKQPEECVDHDGVRRWRLYER